MGWRSNVLMIVLAGLAGLAACQAETDPTEPWVGSLSVAPAAYPFQLVLDVPREVEAGETVKMRVTLKNIGEEPVTVLIGGGNPADLPVHVDAVVMRRDGTPVWNRLPNLLADALVFEGPIEPADSLTWQWDWHQQNYEGDQLAPGSYRIRGILRAGQSKLVNGVEQPAPEWLGTEMETLTIR